ncbi:SAC3 domain-containing protein 1-like [Watersipora subatra]|uniref:SAC3 domain-containing protein 1-like n=1 Tax=Watersipora subatra TaxID=2589382 RepID=UPI00355B7D4B
MDKNGVCIQMCPKEEVAFRTKEKLVHSLEKTSSGEPGVLVKEYRRSAAGRERSDVKQLRTKKALIKTVNYLIDEICNREDVDWPIIYEFVFDRLRAVRQDLTIQSINDDTTVYVLEKCVRFYLISISKLNRHPLNIFDPKINNKHLQETLQQLLVLYNSLDKGANHQSSMVEVCGDNSSRSPVNENDHTFKHRDEFESLYLLFNLGHTESLLHFISLPTHVRSGRWCTKAWKYSLAVLEHNYVRAFRLLHSLEDLQLYSIHYHLPKMQQNLLQRMNVAYSSKACKFPLATLCNLIGGKSIQEMKSLLTSYGLVITEDFVCFNKSTFKI